MIPSGHEVGSSHVRNGSNVAVEQQELDDFNAFLDYLDMPIQPQPSLSSEVHAPHPGLLPGIFTEERLSHAAPGMVQRGAQVAPTGHDDQGAGMVVQPGAAPHHNQARKRAVNEQGSHAPPLAVTPVQMSLEQQLETLQRWLKPADVRHGHIRDLAEMYAPGSRAWLMKEVDDWCALPHQTSPAGRKQRRAFVLYGGPGMGKSTYGAKLVERKIVHVHHFFQHDDTSQSDPQRMLRSLALQLSARLPGMRAALLRLTSINPACDFEGLGDTFCQLLKQPLLTCRPDTPEPDTFVLLDALDEAGSSGDGASQSGNRSALLELLRHQLQELPHWLRFIITSRQEADISQDLAVEFKIMELGSDNEHHKADLAAFVTLSLKTLQVSDPAAVQELLQSSQGSFLYAARALENLEEMRIAGQKLTVEALQNFPPGLHGVYVSYFKKQTKGMDPAQRRQLMRLLEVLVAAREPPSLQQLTDWLQLEDYEADQTLLPRLGSLVVRGRKEAFTTVQLFHKTVYDWLVERSGNNGGYGISAAAGHATICRSVERVHVTQASVSGARVYSRYVLSHGLAHLAHAALAAEAVDNMAAKARWTELLAQLAGPNGFWEEVAAAGAIAEALRESDLYCQALAGKTIQAVLALSEVGNKLCDRGRYRDALPLRQQALKAATQAMGQGHPDTFSSIDCLACCLDSQGRYSEAEPLHRDALEGRMAALGPEHPDTLHSVNNLARCLDGQGRFGESKILLCRALEGRTAALGPNHPDTLTSINNLACCLKGQGQYGEAAQLHRRALEGRNAALGADHRDTLTSVNNLARCLEGQGRYDEAEPLHRRALEGTTSTLGLEHPYTLHSINNLACCLNDQGRYNEAEPLLRHALEGRTLALGPEHPYTLASVNNLARCLEGQGQYSKAEPLHRRALEERMAALGLEHPDTLTSVNNLACCLNDQGQYSEAEPLHRGALEGRKAVLGPEHPDVAGSLAHLADCLYGQARSQEAETLHRHALDLHERLLGPEHCRTAYPLYGLATCLHSLGRHDEAEPLFRRALALRTATRGDKDLATARSAHGLAGCLAAQGRHREAEPPYRQALAVRSALLGASHADTIASERGLADCLIAVSSSR